MGCTVGAVSILLLFCPVGDVFSVFVGILDSLLFCRGGGRVGISKEALDGSIVGIRDGVEGNTVCSLVEMLGGMLQKVCL